MRPPVPIIVLVGAALLIAWAMGRKPVLGALYGAAAIIAAFALCALLLPADDRIISLLAASAAGYGGVWAAPRRSRS